MAVINYVQARRGFQGSWIFALLLGQSTTRSGRGLVLRSGSGPSCLSFPSSRLTAKVPRIDFSEVFPLVRQVVTAKMAATGHTGTHAPVDALYRINVQLRVGCKCCFVFLG